MDKDQEILAISRLVFELTRVSTTGNDLDALLARLHGLLLSLPGLRVVPHSALLLYNPRHYLVQVAQFGLEPTWSVRNWQGHAAPTPPARQCTARIGKLRDLSDQVELVGVTEESPCCILPLNSDQMPMGVALLFIEPDWQPDAVELEFMSELAEALSILVSRTLVNETLRVREVELEHARTDAIRRLGTASEYRDNETGMHIMRMTHYATSIAKALGLSAEERELLSICAPMHDVGKIGIADSILLKPGRLTSDEYEVMKRHTEIGETLLDGNDALITAARDIAAYHHERWDGTGYPRGLRGEAIPILARICSIADVFDALTSIRPYKKPWPFEDAIAYIREGAGNAFDPAVVAAFDQALPEISRIRELYRDDLIDPNAIIELPASAYRPDGWIKWEDSLKIGIDAIDEHHRYLFDLTNDLFDVVAQKKGARDVARVLKALEMYTQVHFRAEERMMAHHGYPEEKSQHHQHRAFEAKLEEFRAELHDNPLTAQFDVLLYLRDWLIRHIRVEDAKLLVLVTP